MRRFPQSYPPPATVILVSGDINFAAELSDLRHRHNLHVICLHNAQAQGALLECAHEARRFDHFTADLPVVFPPKVNKFFFSLLMPVFHFEYFENFEFNNYLEAEMNYTTNSTYSCGRYCALLVSAVDSKWRCGQVNVLCYWATQLTLKLPGVTKVEFLHKISVQNINQISEEN